MRISTNCFSPRDVVGLVIAPWIIINPSSWCGFFCWKAHKVFSKSQYEAATAESKDNNLQLYQHGNPLADEKVFLGKVISVARSLPVQLHNCIRIRCHQKPGSLLLKTRTMTSNKILSVRHRKIFRQCPVLQHL